MNEVAASREAALEQIANGMPHIRAPHRFTAAVALAKNTLALPDSLAEAASAVVRAYDQCSGAEPSQSVLDRAIDVDLRMALEKFK